jgi:hypothetical protein
VIEQPVEDGRGEHLIVGDVSLVYEALVRGNDDARPPVAATEEAEEDACFFPVHGQIPHLIEDEMW